MKLVYARVDLKLQRSFEVTARSARTSVADELEPLKSRAPRYRATIRWAPGRLYFTEHVAVADPVLRRSCSRAQPEIALAPSRNSTEPEGCAKPGWRDVTLAV